MPGKIVPVTARGSGCIPDCRNYTVHKTCTRVVHREPETGSIAAGYLFNDIARAYIDLFVKIPILPLSMRTNGDGWPGNDLAKAKRDRSFSRDDDYVHVLAARRGATTVKYRRARFSYVEAFRF